MLLVASKRKRWLWRFQLWTKWITSHKWKPIVKARCAVSSKTPLISTCFLVRPHQAAQSSQGHKAAAVASGTALSQQHPGAENNSLFSYGSFTGTHNPFLVSLFKKQCFFFKLLSQTLPHSPRLPLTPQTHEPFPKSSISKGIYLIGWLIRTHPLGLEVESRGVGSPQLTKNWTKSCLCWQIGW